MFEKAKVKVKIHPLFSQSKAKDVVTGIMFSSSEWVEIESKDWDRLKEKNWTLDGKSYPLLIEVEEVSEVEDNEASDDYVDESDIEDLASDGSVLQDTEVEEE